MRIKKKRGFTLIEVLAALGIIIVLTLALLTTIRSQMDRADRQNLAATVETVNVQIAVAYAQNGRRLADFASVNALAAAGIISDAQREQLAGARYDSTAPPKFSLP